MPSSGLLTLYHPALDAGSIPSRHPQPKAKRFGLGIQLVWIPACAGMTKKTRGCHPLPSSRTWCGIQSCLDSRFHGNDKEEIREWLKEDTGMTSGMRMIIDKLRTMLNNPTGQTPRYSLFCYLKWLHPCGKPQGIQLSWNKRKCCVSRESNHKYQNLFANWRSKSPLPRRQLHRPAGF